jgi:predicted transcriptional regulator
MQAWKMFVLERIERGGREANDGNLLEQDEVESRMLRWLDE